MNDARSATTARAKLMAVLPDADRADVHADWMRNADFPGDVLKADLRAAVNAADTWVDDNAGSYNTALPLPFRPSATAAQKALLLQFVVAKRFLSGV